MNVASSHVRLFLIACALVSVSCEVPFDPKEDFRNLVAVYGVLSDRTDTVTVRVFRSYNPESFDPWTHTVEEQVYAAVVALSDGISSIPLGESLTARKDTSRYKDSVLAYVAYPVPIVKGRTYQLNLQTPDGQSLTAHTTAPTTGTIGVANTTALVSPQLYPLGINFQATLSPLARGFRVRFLVRFEVNESGQWNMYTREIPREITDQNTPMEQWHYHELTRRTTEQDESREVVTFATAAYQRGMSSIRQEFSGLQIRWLEALFVLAQVDLHLYNYYSIANGFRDPYSTRVDQPDYSNIGDGVGVFGSMVHDSSRFIYPVSVPFVQ